MIRLLMLRGKPLEELHSYWAVQLNDTHPSIAVAELMRHPGRRPRDDVG